MATLHTTHLWRIYLYSGFGPCGAFTLGMSTIGVAVAAPAIHNARKKRETIEKHLQKLGTTHSTRKRDVIGPMAVNSSIGVVTLGVGAVGADVISQAGAEQGISVIVENELAVKATTHLALEAAVVGAEHHHAENKKSAEAYKHSQNAGYTEPQEKGYGQEQDYGDQIQPPPAYTLNGFTHASTDAPLNRKNQGVMIMYQSQSQRSSPPPPQQLYIPQQPHLAQAKYASMTQELKPLEPPAFTFASSSSYASFDCNVTDLGYIYVPQLQQLQPQQHYRHYAPSILSSNQHAMQPQYVHGQYLPQPPPPAPQHLQQQYAQQDNHPQSQYNLTLPVSPPATPLRYPQLQQAPYLPPPSDTPQTSSQSHGNMKSPMGYNCTLVSTGQSSAPQTQLKYGYPTPVPTPCGQNPDQGYFEEPHHG